MKFIDEAKIYIRSGDGGNGCVSFRREKYVAEGGPNGGDGGRGGSIIFVANSNMNTLVNFRYAQHFKAKSGQSGKGANKYGKSGEDTILEVPVGTQIFAEDGASLVYDFTKDGEEFKILPGGRGGLGNSHFKSSINRAPTRAIPGEEGQELWVWLKLKILSDAGIIGLPNAGKSTFLAKVSAAKPKIADYPFTTLTPNLGVIYIDHEEFVLADIPGLIEGAHLGSGLGHRFLKHIERCGVLLHLVDGMDEDVAQNYRIIRSELEQYSPKLSEKVEILCLNKADALSEEDIEEKKKQLAAVSNNKKIHIISAIARENIDVVLRSLLEEVKKGRDK
jgi:GTP-binding protein